MNNQTLLQLIDSNCPDWIIRPESSWDKIKILQSIMDQALPGFLSLKIESLNEKEIVGTIPYRNETANVVGYMHGGTIYSAGDTLAGAFLWSKSDGSHFAVTKKSEIRYLRPFKNGILRCTVGERSRSGKKACLEAYFQDEEGRAVSEVEMEFSLVMTSVS